MKNKLIQNKKIIFSISIILLIISAITFQQSQNNSAENKEFSEKIEEIISQKQEIVQKSTISEKTGKTNSSKIVESETIEVEPQEYSVVAEEILYPDEYDFGTIDGSVALAIGTPIKIDTLPIVKAKIGDTIEITFGGETYTSEISEITEDYFPAEEADEYKEDSIVHFFKTKKDEYRFSIDGSFIYTELGIIKGRINLNHGGGALDYTIQIDKGLGYYYRDTEWQKEFYNQGYRID